MSTSNYDTDFRRMSQQHNYRRFNPLLAEWVIVAANRASRPWHGATSDKPAAFTSTSAVNQLAPGGHRNNGTITPAYTSTYVFDNDFPSFTHFEGHCGEEARTEDELFQQQLIRGVCRVICYHPDSSMTMAKMSPVEMRRVVDVWLQQFDELKQKYTWIQIFENRGAASGCSNSHPHGQLWAGDFLPNLPARKDKTQRDYKSRTGRVMLLDYAEKEITKQERIVCINSHWVVLVPFWAVWPFETMLLPRRHVTRLDELSKAEKTSLAAIIQQHMTKYDNLFTCPFAFSMGWLGAPTGKHIGEDMSHWQLHALYHPPLLRSASVAKHMAGYEILAEPQRDITAEQAAQRLRDQPDKLTY